VDRQPEARRCHFLPGEHSSEHRAQDEAEAECGAEVAHRLCPVLGWRDVGDESLGGTQRAVNEAAYDADRDRQLECGRPGEGDVAQRRAERGYREDLSTAPRIRLPAPVDLAKDVAEAVRREQ